MDGLLIILMCIFGGAIVWIDMKGVISWDEARIQHNCMIGFSISILLLLINQIV